MAVSDWSTSAASNLTVGGVSIGEGMSRSDVNDALRSIMAEAKARFIETVNVKDYGAAGDGTTDDTSAIATAVATGKAIYFPKGTYVSTQIVPTSDGQQFYGDGPGLSTIRLKNGATGYLLSSNDKQVHIRDLRFYGGDDTGKTGVVTEPVAASADDRSGVEFDCDLETTIHNVVIHGFKNRGLAARSGSGTSRQGGVAISNVHSYNCWMGFEAGPNVAEYLRVANSTFNGCNVGVRTSSGNQTFTGCIVSDNYKNVHLLGTGIGNNSHGSMIGCLLNHGTIWAIHAEDVTNGFSFIGCNMFYGSVELTNCYGVIIQGGIFDLAGFGVTGGGRNYVIDNYCDDGLDNLYNPAGGGVITFHRNFRADGTFVLNNEMVKFGASSFTAGDQPVIQIGENGAMETDGLRVSTNGGTGLIKFQAFNGGALVANPTLTILRTNGNLGFFGATPVARQTVAAAATDAATTQTLANDLRAALIALGLAV